MDLTLSRIARISTVLFTWMWAATVLPGCANFGSPNTSFKVPEASPSLPVDGPGSESQSVPIPNPSPSPTSTPRGIPPYSFKVGAVGYTSTHVEVRAGYVLKITFTPGIQDENIVGTSFSPPYSRLGVYIQVGNTSQPTPMLSNGLSGFGAGAETSPSLDFSNVLPCVSRPSEDEDTEKDCRSRVTITITKPNNDFFCLTSPQLNGSCPWTQVWSTHPWHGQLNVQTDDTDSI